MTTPPGGRSWCGSGLWGLEVEVMSWSHGPSGRRGIFALVCAWHVLGTPQVLCKCRGLPPPRSACHQGRRARGFLKAMLSCLEGCRSVWRWGSGSPLSSGALVPAGLLCGPWKLLASLACGGMLGPQWGGTPSAFLSWPQISWEGQKLLTAPFICSLSPMILEPNC